MRHQHHQQNTFICRQRNGATTLGTGRHGAISQKRGETHHQPKSIWKPVFEKNQIYLWMLSSGCQMIPPKKRKPLPHFHACVHLKCSRWSIITQITLDRWAGDFNKKLKEIFHFDFDLPAVFIDTFHRRTNQHEVSVFILQSKMQCNAFTCELNCF